MELKSLAYLKKAGANKSVAMAKSEAIKDHFKLLNEYQDLMKEASDEDVIAIQKEINSAEAEILPLIKVLFPISKKNPVKEITNAKKSSPVKSKSSVKKELPKDNLGEVRKKSRQQYSRLLTLQKKIFAIPA